MINPFLFQPTPSALNRYARLDLTWSQKSLETMRDVIELGLDRCLSDHPRQLDGKMKSRCGNGIVEDGEECDCGTQEVSWERNT